jgi:hypothetical protein
MAKNNIFRQSIFHVTAHNKDGSYATQSARKETLLMSAKDLTSCGYNKVSPKNFGARHATLLSNFWKEKGISNATIKNRLAHLRWYASAINKPTAIPRNNDLFVQRRTYTSNENNKAKDLDLDKLDALTDRQNLSLKLQRFFGLRREESLKFNPMVATKKDNKIVLKASWCKGGRTREIIIRTQAQKDLLDQCEALVGNNSMIEKGSNYINARDALDKACQRAEIKNMHGFRHAYAQERYQEITGHLSPKQGGIISKDMSAEQKIIDSNARLIISKELGHSREEITVIYLGK